MSAIKALTVADGGGYDFLRVSLPPYTKKKGGSFLLPVARNQNIIVKLLEN